MQRFCSGLTAGVFLSPFYLGRGLLNLVFSGAAVTPLARLVATYIAISSTYLLII